MATKMGTTPLEHHLAIYTKDHYTALSIYPKGVTVDVKMFVSVLFIVATTAREEELTPRCCNGQGRTHGAAGMMVESWISFLLFFFLCD